MAVICLKALIKVNRDLNGVAEEVVGFGFNEAKTRQLDRWEKEGLMEVG